MKPKECTKCLSCDSQDLFLLYELKAYNILKCCNCHLVFTDTNGINSSGLYSADYFEKFQGKYFLGCYNDYINHRQNPALTRLEQSLSLLTRHNGTGKLLDVGCATGIFLDMAKKQGWQPYGVDISKYASECTRSRFGIKVETCELQNASFSPKSFDAITIWSTIEHVSNPKQVLSKCSQLLKDDGLLFLSTVDEGSLIPRIADALYKITKGKLKKPIELVHPIHHVTHFSKATIIRMLNDAGFNVIRFGRSEMPLRSMRWAWYVKVLIGVMYLSARILNMQYEIKLLAHKV